MLPSTESACLSGFVEPFDTYVDMTAVKDREGWQPGDQTAHLAYFCTVLPDDQIPDPGTDPHFPSRQFAVVKENALTFVKTSLATLWPRSSAGASGFDWKLLVDVAGATGDKRLDAQYWRANIDPSARYVLSPPGSSRFRLHPDASGVDNLYLAGDWTFTPMNSGCVEAATMSGFKAARAITGSRKRIYGWE